MESYLFSFVLVREGYGSQKARKPTPIWSVKSANLERRDGMLAWRCWILGLDGSSSRIEQMDVRVLSMWMFASSLSDIHFQDELSWFVRHLLGDFPF